MVIAGSERGDAGDRIGIGLVGMDALAVVGVLAGELLA
jgi:hypothetical protein